ncbi:MAG: mono/diheme cytochrome c family protein [Planctomycetota bacterium]|jgi:mono/diheme cytochrome c family protein
MKIRKRLLSKALFCGCVALGACSLEFASEQREFGLSKTSVNMLAGSEESQVQLLAELERLFGTPANPHFGARENLSERAAIELNNRDYASLRDSALLYGKKCLHCHGNEGGGDGATARTARPFPRDFRFGVFKYNNLAEGAKPERSDLFALIKNGIEGTGMPSLKQHSDSEINGLVDYVRFLSMRGEVEYLLAEEFEGGETPDAETSDQELAAVLDLWVEAQRTRVIAPIEVPEPSVASIRRGYGLFHDSTRANCAGCHGSNGTGRGSAAFGPSPVDPEKEVALLRDIWNHEALPANLQQDKFRHGHEPKELYELFYLGINGTPMPGLGEALGSDGKRAFDEDALWSLVHYVRALRDPVWSELMKEFQTLKASSVR